MEKMKMGIVTVATLVLVAVAVSALVISFGMVQAVGPVVTEHVSAVLKLKQQGADVDVDVKAQGLASTATFTVRAYSVTDCSGSKITEIGTATSDSNGNLVISGTISTNVVSNVDSVSIRDDGGGTPGNIVVCFQDIT